MGGVFSSGPRRLNSFTFRPIGRDLHSNLHASKIDAVQKLLTKGGLYGMPHIYGNMEQSKFDTMMRKIELHPDVHGKFTRFDLNHVRATLQDHLVRKNDEGPTVH